MKKYKIHQLLASIWIAIFIVSFSLCLTVLNRSVYSRTVAESHDDFYQSYLLMKSPSKQLSEDINRELVAYEMEIDYKNLAEDFSSFFKGNFDSVDYDINADNIDKLKDLKFYYRISWLFAIASFIGTVYSFNILRLGRYYSPFLYGGLGATILTSVNALILFTSDKAALVGVRNMVLHEDYSYFSVGDLLTMLFPPEYARNMAYTYLFFVFVMVLLVVLIRLFLIYRGRPHKF